MNSYNPNGKIVVSILLAISIMFAGGIHTILDVVKFKPQWWISAPSAVVIYQILYYTFEHFIWKCRLLRYLHIVTVPNLNGKWKGRIKSSYRPDEQDYPISVIITQQWSKILIRLETKESHSKSIAASFLMEDPSSPELVYVYDNEPQSMVPESMHPHSGTTRLRLDGSVLQGKYYTGRGRKTIGDIRLEKYSS